MVQIKVNRNGVVPEGMILEPLYIDNVGDARLSDEDEEIYGTSWLFKGDFEVLDEQGAEYVVTLKLKDLLELHDLLQVLPRSLVESATLEKI